MSTWPTHWQPLMAHDRAHVWHPFTQMKDHETDPPLPVIGGEGPDLILADGRRLLDGISSWWTCLHGHSHPRLMGALARQGAQLDHVMFAGFTHEPAIELTRRLLPLLPPGLTRCFFSDNGSTAVEVALKMAFQAQFQRGERGRDRFGALREGYHGDTLGAVGVGELDNYMSGIFRPLLLRAERMSVPEDPRCALETPGDLAPLLAAAQAEVDTFFETHGATLAAFIVEPLVQGAGGMRMWPPEILQAIRKACDHHGVYLIHDEVMTGFGRTGTLFATEQTRVTPDLLCLSKGLTGGTLPLSLTWATEALFGHFWGDYCDGRTFFHGHSYTGNPIACAVAVASLQLIEENGLLHQVQELSQTLRKAWHHLADHPCVRHPRTLGAIAACAVVDPATNLPHPMASRFSWRFHRAAAEAGLLVRPIGNCLYLLPPLTTPADRIHEAVAILRRLLDSWT